MKAPGAGFWEALLVECWCALRGDIIPQASWRQRLWTVIARCLDYSGWGFEGFGLRVGKLVCDADGISTYQFQ